MKTISLLITLSVPDGVTATVTDGAAAPAHPQADVAAPPLEFPPFPDDASSKPICKIHHTEMRPSTKPGVLFYCNKKTGPGDRDWCKESVRA